MLTNKVAPTQTTSNPLNPTQADQTEDSTSKRRKITEGHTAKDRDTTYRDHSDEEESETYDYIDEKEERPRVPLPKRNLLITYRHPLSFEVPTLYKGPHKLMFNVVTAPPLPPAFDEVGNGPIEPENNNANPHLMKSDRLEGKATMPEDTTRAVMDLTFDRLVISQQKLLRNFAIQQRTEILANPTRVTFAIFFNAGLGLITLFKDLAESLEACIRSTWPKFDSSRLRVYMPIPLHRKPHPSKYDAPWALPILGLSEEARLFLRKLQTVVLNEELTFHIIGLEDCTTSWALTHFQGSAVRNDDDSKQMALRFIRQRLWKDVRIHNIVNNCLVAQGTPGTNASRVESWMKTWNILYVNSVDKNAAGGPKEVPLYLLTASPISSDDEQIKLLIDHIRTLDFEAGMDTLSVAQWQMSCNICKLDTHCDTDCSFLRTPGWYGPQGDIEHMRTKNGGTSYSRGRARGSRGPRGARSARGRGSRARGRGI
jgi:hypothetical protein